MIVERIRSRASPGLEIPKPEAKKKFLVKGWGTRRGEDALIYLIPNQKVPSKPHQKGITVSEFEAAYRQLTSTGELTHQWFDEHLSKCAKEGSCNFTTIGGVFELLDEAKYAKRGLYERKE